MWNLGEALVSITLQWTNPKGSCVGWSMKYLAILISWSEMLTNEKYCLESFWKLGKNNAVHFDNYVANFYTNVV